MKDNRGYFKVKIIISNECAYPVEITNINGNMPAEALKRFLNLDQDELIDFFKDHIKELNRLDDKRAFLVEYLCKIEYFLDSETYLVYYDREETSYFWDFELICYKKTKQEP